jgi:hypothetical protein
MGLAGGGFREKVGTDEFCYSAQVDSRAVSLLASGRAERLLTAMTGHQQLSSGQAVDWA